MKTVQICIELHRDLAIASATSGLMISTITDKAIRIEIARMNLAAQQKAARRVKRVSVKAKKVSVKV